ncbi:protein ASPARTIC PROTEASE IN GUARD CELL 1-like [Coffea arabica]|uniref:Protein ASPARTIC PROTEASE IN GUARD CELL 1-like n=1 Tax=Coffea arabica TaxID=13443 RepID=A0ABM4U1R1_COFAR
MAREGQRPFPSVNIFIILSFFSLTLSPFSPQVVSASVFKRLQLFSTEKTQPSSTSSVLSLSLHPHSSIIKPPYDNYSDLECTSLGTNQNCKADPCTYEASYGDNSSTTGEFATETVSFRGSGSADKVAIGCGHANQGGFGGAAGILGLGGTPVGFPSQIRATSFSYCLVDMDSNSSSSLEFNSAPPGDSVFVPLIINPIIQVYYYVELTGVTINGEKVSIPPSDYQIDQDGGGGIIIDSGTTITEFPTQVYNSFRDTFVKYARALPPMSGFDDGLVKFDTCYDLSSEHKDGYPTMSFEFHGGKTLSLRPANYLVRVDTRGKHCLAFTGTTERVSIIGNIQQQGMRVTYDLTNKLIGFSPNQC